MKSKLNVNHEIIKFGTAGIRGKFFELTPVEAFFSIVLVNPLLTEKVVIARDGRNNGSALLNAVEAGLFYLGKKPLNASIVPTPTLQYYCFKHNIAGVMVTASHNPPEWNGIKVIKKNGVVLKKEEGNKILDEQTKVFGEIKKTLYKPHNNKENVEITKDYIEAVIKFANIKNPDKIGKIVVDYGNGVASVVFSPILKKLGINAKEINKKIDGNFPGRNSEPKEQNLKQLIELVKKENYSIGIAFDGDGDRCTFVLKDEFLDGNKSFAIILEYWLSKHKGDVATTVITTKAIEDIAKKHGRKVYYTKVGTSYLSEKLETTNAVIAGEESSGVIIKQLHLGKDGIVTALLMLKLIEEGKLIDIMKKLPKYYTIKINMPVDKEIKLKVMEVVKEKIRERAKRNKESLVELDGIRANGKDYWYIIRPSGTEHLIRLLVEATNKEKAENLSNQLKQSLLSIIEEIS